MQPAGREQGKEGKETGVGAREAGSKEALRDPAALSLETLPSRVLIAAVGVIQISAVQGM